MNFLGIDYGVKRIGLSFADALGVAVPLEPAIEKTLEERLRHIERVVKERSIEAIVIGYPLNMDGSVGFKAEEVDLFIKKLEKKFGITIYRQDERLSSHQAENDLRVLGMGGKEKSVKSRQKKRNSGDIDSRSAAIILQDFLEREEF